MREMIEREEMSLLCKIALIINIFIVLIFQSVSLFAEDDLSYTHLIHPSIGTFKFCLPNIPNDNERKKLKQEDYVETEIVVSSLSEKKIIQRIPTTFPVVRGWIEFMDVNDDGFTDILIYNTPGGVGPLMHAEIWMYIPKQAKFAMCKTLSYLGEVTKSKKSGCIKINYRNDDFMTYSTDEWCFNIKYGRWKRISTVIDK